MKRFVIPLLILVSVHATAQWKGRSAPPYLANEIFRLSKDCYYFKEFLLIKQGKQYYVLASYLNREAMGERPENNPQFAKPVSPCGKRLQQVRLYRWISDKKVVFKDSIFFGTYSIALGSASDFDNAGTSKVIINHICSAPRNAIAPLLCYAFSIIEITQKEKLRSVLSPDSLPERYINGEPQGYPLEPVVTDNFDKSSNPECLAIDDFGEGDPAFRPDDFPKVTLVYAWDTASRQYKHHSEKFLSRFTLPASVDSLPENIHLVQFIENTMSIAAIGKSAIARKYLDLGMTPEWIAQWKLTTPTARNTLTSND